MIPSPDVSAFAPRFATTAPAVTLTIIGTGYVGLVSGTCFAEIGARVICVDKDAEKIRQLEAGMMPIYEPGLETLVASNRESGRLSFTSRLVEAVETSEILFIAVGTPPNPETGEADLSYVFAVAEEIAALLTPGQFRLIVTKSTVPIGTGERIADRIRAINPQATFAVASNPEFLREGSAIEDFLAPDRIVIGTDTPEAESLLTTLYSPLTARGAPLLATSIKSAEMIKYASNSFLATKVAFINEMADVCDYVGANVEDVARGMGMDARIGQKFLKAGPGIGGSCFPKDTRALVQLAVAAGSDATIVRAAIAANESHKERMAKKILASLPHAPERSTVAALGLTFKAGTDDVRESPSITILSLLAKAGVTIRAYDPEGMENAQQERGDMFQYAEDTYAAMQGADALVILTEWEQFKTLDWARVKAALAHPLVLDLRNLYTPEEVRTAGLHYKSVGRP